MTDSRIVFTVEEARLHCYHIPGLHCKNLFLKDSIVKRFYLITLPATKKVEIKLLRKIVGAKKLSFAKPEELKRILNLDPGSVSPFGLINDDLNQVHYYIDKEVWNAEKVCSREGILVSMEQDRRALAERLGVRPGK